MHYSFDECFAPIVETALKIEIEDAFQQRINAFVQEEITTATMLSVTAFST